MAHNFSFSAQIPEFSITDIDGFIEDAQNSLSLLPRSDHTYINCVQALAIARFNRYELSQEKEDLDRSILHCTEAIFLPPIFGPAPFHNIVQILLHLALVLLNRSENFELPEDVMYSIEYLRYLRGLPPDSFDIPRKVVITALIQVLGTRDQLEPGGGTQNIGEMVVLCRELLASNITIGFPVAAFISLFGAVSAEFNRGRSVQLLDEVIECLRDAVRACPQGSHRLSFALASSLYIRFDETHSIDDYEDGMALLEMILDPNRPGECPDPLRSKASEFAILFTITRSTIFDNPEYSEMAISRLRAELNSSSIDERLRFRVTEALATRARERFTHYNLAENLEEASSYISQSIDLSSSPSLEKSGLVLAESDDVREAYSTTAIQQKIRHLEGLLPNTPPGTRHHINRLSELATWYETKYSHTDDISDIEVSIMYRRRSLDATHPSDPWRMNPIGLLRNILYFAFEKTGKINFLDESILLGYDILKLKGAGRYYFYAVRWLVSSLLTRARLLRRREDLYEAIRLVSLAIDNQYAHEHDRFQLSCELALVARLIQHPSTLNAYKSAMSLMGKPLSFAATVSIQHTRLVAISEDCQRLPLDYASYQIDLGQFEEAIETLEQGRTLIWSEMRGLRTEISRVIGEDPQLAKRFTEINQELEAMTVSATPSGRPEMDDGIVQGGDWSDAFGRLVIERQKLMDERDALVSQIQGRPGLEGLFKTPSFSTLRSAASRGPVVLINHCEWRSDILILSHNSLPCAIPTANDFYDRANKLRHELVEARKHGLDSLEYQDALSSVLKGLYELVGEPVIKRLRLLGVPEQSRIWWCPTSVFCSLPLHAMGPIPSSDSPKRYFSDLYIPSYTPSLSALIESRKENPQMLDKPSLLLVAQPDASLPGVWGEIEIVQALNARVTNLVLNAATPSSVVEGLRGSQFAHFACHGELETGKPFEASFKLHDGSRLKLLDIVQSRLPNAEFALLSCCHTAEITEDSIGDEALHLTAAMQYCGFRSVVGTMWAMADTDGQDLAKNFYRSLFSGRRADVPYYERSARALRDATQKLRKKRGITLERWVNFVHYRA